MVLNLEKRKLKTKRTFLKKGTCSKTFFYLLNKEFGVQKEKEEQAIDPLAGGIASLGHQCGMLWGASMAIGAEAYRRCNSIDQAMIQTIKTTQFIMRTFKDRAKSIDCNEITQCNYNSKWALLKYMLTGKFFKCFNLADKWAPEAIKAANEGLIKFNVENSDEITPSINCASEIIRKMGGTEEEMVMVAGFAGGLGLSGHGCGALSAALWKTTFDHLKKEKRKSSLNDPISKKVLKAFYKITNGEILCHKITNTTFDSIANHSNFIENSGCKHIIDCLGTKMY